MESYAFGERLAMSQGISAGASVADILFRNVPGATAVSPASRQDDRRGTDWWVALRNGHKLSVDCKVRGEDYLRSHGKDDLALESWSVVEREIVGWTRDPDKRCDYVLWLWTDTGRWCLVPFAMLCRVFIDGWVEWRERYSFCRQFTPNFGGYHSECIFVPRREIWAAIYKTFGGQSQPQ